MKEVIIYDWFNDVNPVLEKKFGDIRDFAVYKKQLRKSTFVLEREYESEWFGKQIATIDSEHANYFNSPDGWKKCKELYPIWDFWILVCNHTNLSNDSIHKINWSCFLECIDSETKWAEEIVNYILEIFPSEMYISFSW